MASGIARGRVRTTAATAATESRNMAAKHQMYSTKYAALIYHVPL